MGAHKRALFCFVPLNPRLDFLLRARYCLLMAFFRSKKVYTEDELYDYAIGSLARRMRSVAELKRMLRRRVESETDLGDTLVELVIRRLKDQGYLNDSRYAASYSSYRRDNEKFGRMRVISDLKTKGVHGEVIEQAVSSAYHEVNEEKQAREYLRRKRLKKPSDQKDAARISRNLMRAGFAPKTIFSILKRWDVDDEILSALESENN
jgi:regulatory protein